MGSQTSTTITERKTRLDGSTTEFLCEPLVIDPGKRAVLRYVSERVRAIEGTDLRAPAGTVTVAHYWVDRPYNVYHLRVADRTLAYYCNLVAKTTVEPALVSYTDLIVDVVLRESGAAEILDEDELPDDLAPAYRGAIAKGLEALITNPRMVIREIERETAEALRRA